MTGFDDLLDANRAYAATFDAEGMPGAAKAGVAVVTCMDSRIPPLRMLGLGLGDAKIIRTPGGRVDSRALEGVVLATNLLGVDRVMVVCHTKCAVGSNTSEQLSEKVAEASGLDTSSTPFHGVADQVDSLADDVQKIRTHPLVAADVLVGGFRYDVDTGLIEQLF